MKGFKKLLIYGLLGLGLIIGCTSNKGEEQDKIVMNYQKKFQEQAIERNEKAGFITGTVTEEVRSSSSTGGLEGSFRFFGDLLSSPDGKGKIKGNYLGTIQYALALRTDKGKNLGVSIVDVGNYKSYALDAIIKPGTRIKFPAGNLKNANTWPIQFYKEENWFNNGTSIGSKRADRITILDN